MKQTVSCYVRGAKRRDPFPGATSLCGHIVDRPRREIKERKTKTIVMKCMCESKVKM